MRLSFPVLLLVVVLLLWGGWQVAVTGRLFGFMDQHPTTGGYGIPLRYSRAAAQEAQRLAGSSEIVVLSSGMNPAVDEVPAVFDALLFDHPHRFADGRVALLVPDSPQVVYLVGPVTGEDDVSSELYPITQRLRAMAYVRPGSVVSLPDGWHYCILSRSGPDREDALVDLTRFPDLIMFANGTGFLGYGMPERARSGEALEVWLAWWVRSLPPSGVNYHFFAHLLDGDGRLRSQYDGTGFPTAYWKAGDLVLSRFSMPVSADSSAGPYQASAGLYSYPDVVNVPFLDIAGNPAGDRVMLGEVTLEGQ